MSSSVVYSSFLLTVPITLHYFTITWFFELEFFISKVHKVCTSQLYGAANVVWSKVRACPSMCVVYVPLSTSKVIAIRGFMHRDHGDDQL